jgi:hypothetical protein
VRRPIVDRGARKIIKRYKCKQEINYGRDHESGKIFNNDEP